MPYETLKDLPDEIKALPKHAQEIWMAAFNAALEQYKDEDKAIATAWAAVKMKYKKEGDRWVAKEATHMEGKWIAVFRTGRHTDSAGNTRDWTKDDLDHAIAAYNPAEHEAPIVIGHPEMNAPAYGWVSELKRKDENLYARLKQVVPEFVDIVRRGLFKKRSIAFYPDGTLRHIGFLGASIPAVKGLADVGFKSGEVAAMFEYDPFPEESNFAATDEEKEAQKKRSTKYKIAFKEGGHVPKPSEWDDVADDDFLDPVNYRYPCPDADQTRAAASYWDKPKNQAQYSAEERVIITQRLDAKKKKFNIALKAGGQEGKKKTGGTTMSVKDRLKGIFSKGLENLPDDDALLQDDLPRTFTQAEVKAEVEKKETETREDERKKVEEEFAEKGKKERADKMKGEVKEFVEKLSKEGKIIPAWQKMGLAEFMEALDFDEPLQFAEAKDKQSRLDWFKSFLEELPKMVTFKEIATRDKDTGAQGEFMALVEKYEKEKELTRGKAIAFAARQHPEIHQEYLDQLNAK